MSPNKIVWMGMGVGHKQISNIIETAIIECFHAIKSTVLFICPCLVRQVHGKKCHKALHRGRGRQFTQSNKSYARRAF